MIKVLHTSDWHLGRKLDGYDQSDVQRRALQWIVDTVRDEHIDVVLVSGDVYDTKLPGDQQVAMLGEVLTNLAHIERDGKPAVDVILIPGNHDSAVKLGFLSPLMPDNLHICAEVDGVATPVMVERGDERLAVYAFPYLYPSVARFPLNRLLHEADPDLPEDEVLEETTQAVTGAAIRLASRDLAKRRESDPSLASILMMHANVASRLRGKIGEKRDDFSGGDTEHAASESPLIVGTAEAIPSEYFAGSGFDYLALGHIHKPQTVTIVGDGQLPQARYCGSLLAYDADDVKQSEPREGNYRVVDIVTIDGGKVTDISERFVESGQRRIVNLKGDIDDILGPECAQYRDDFVNLTFGFDPEKHKDPWGEIHTAFSTVLGYKPTAYGEKERTAGDGRAIQRNVDDPLDVMLSFVRDVTGRDATAQEKKVLGEALKRAQNVPQADASGAKRAGVKTIAAGGRRGRRSRATADVAAIADAAESVAAESKSDRND